MTPPPLAGPPPADVPRQAGPLRIGLLGAGMIASFDWGILPGFHHLQGAAELTAIAAPSDAHTGALAAEYGIPHVYRSVDEMLEADTVDAVVNITPIAAHAETSLKILSAGKHLISEKPLASTLAEADELIDTARAAGVMIVCSPPRMLEPARVRARELVRQGAIGTVAFARVRSSHAGPAWQAWPADPSWFYAADAGPLMDMGPYGIQEITGILGPARAVMAMSGRTSETRTVAGGPFAGSIVPVEADDNTLLLLDFGGGAFAMVDCTFNLRAATSPDVEIFGHAGTIVLGNDRVASEVPALQLYRVSDDGVNGEWRDATGPGYRRDVDRIRAVRRAILVQHLLDCLVSGAPPVLSAEHARHTLEIILAAKRSAATGRRVELATSF
ncbi:Gfo/Idh/MocA family protein [Compostimonas suwonensis]|uniref:Putative dehydrogenase n=1 Tax=Compostimonas suwonensis TaxID=1048394 RepID=A0A2M9BB90_9MICO|nr:Gfo/Idh/MocA family oxidoreductase [Compostimonas suwonensis]PJJ55206.1 putative dehydrogenase [Compostimonas suwonensis]